MTQKALFDFIQTKAHWNIVDEEGCFSEDNSGRIFENFADDMIRIDEGVSKFVIIPKGEDFVFKIGFDHDCDGEKIDNGCETEALYYHYSIQDSLDDYFATTAFYDFIFTPDGCPVPVYVQEKVEPLCDRGSTCEGLTKEEKITMRSKVSSYYGGGSLDACWIKDFIDCYGEEELEYLMQFLDENSINDLHRGNIGYKDGKPVIFDFSGYESFS